MKFLQDRNGVSMNKFRFVSKKTNNLNSNELVNNFSKVLYFLG